MNVPPITIPNFRPKCSKYIPVFRPKQLKNHTLWGGTYLHTLYRGVPPPPRACNHHFLQEVPFFRGGVVFSLWDPILHPLWGLSYAIMTTSRCFKCVPLSIHMFGLLFLHVLITYSKWSSANNTACFRRLQTLILFFLQRRNCTRGTTKMSAWLIFFKSHRKCATASATILAKTAETFHVSSQVWHQEKVLSE